MKKALLISVLLSITNIMLGQWNNYNVIKENTILFDVHFTNSENGWIVGSKSAGDESHLAIYHSSDGGNNLEIQYVNSSCDGYPSSVCFVNSSTGWVASDEIILHTNDGGATWVQQDGGIITGGGGIDVFFIDEQTGWIAGSKTILKTTDGGTTWMNYSISEGSLHNIHFSDELHGWAVGWYPGGSGWQNGILLMTDDGGTTWVETIINDIRLEDVFFVSENEGWMIGQEHQNHANFDPIIFHTIDGGINWEEQYSGNAGDSWDMNIFFNDSIHGWASCGWMSGDNQILYTEDRGANWIERDDIITLGGVNSIFFTDAQHGYMVGEGGNFMRTQNTGQNWATKGFYNKPIHSVSFADDLNGMALMGQWIIWSYAYYLIKTNDGGENWQVQRPLFDDTFSPGFGSHSLFMHDSLHLTLIPLGCEYPSFYRSADGGLTWDTIALPGNNNTQYCGQFINPDTGWVAKSVDNQGTSVLRTYNAGIDWEEFEMSSDDLYINSVFFPSYFGNSKFGCVVGQSSGLGVILTTKDGGETWIQSYWGVPLNDVFFTDETNGWIVGGDMDNYVNIILHTTDGGQTWATQESGTDNALNSVWFTNVLTGWVAGNNGTILYTPNGGEYWEVSPCPVEESLLDVYFLEEFTGWVSGYSSLLEYDGIWTSVKRVFNNSSDKLFEIHPNPVLSSTTISFETKQQQQNIELSIYDLSGKVVEKQTVKNQTNDNYQLQVDCSELKSGVYFCHLQVGNKGGTKKLIKIE